MRDCQVRLGAYPTEGEWPWGFEIAILVLCRLVMIPSSAKGVFNDQKEMWPSVLAVQRWIEVSK